MTPDPLHIAAVQRLLRASQGPFVAKPRLPIIDELVATVLSQHTSDHNSERAFAQLKGAFPDWEQVLAAPAGAVADVIRCGGIADQKARRIQQILAAIRAREGRIDLSRLQDLGDAAVEEYLISLPGVGPKTAACVLVFSMGRAAFPVDTHVHRVATRLGWIPAAITAAQAYRILAPAVPPGIRYDLHLALITHGRAVCQAQRPRCDACVLRDECAYGCDGLLAPVRKVKQNHLAGRNRHIHIGAHIAPRVLRQDDVRTGRKIVKLKRFILRDALPRSDHGREHHSVGPIGGRLRMPLAGQRFHQRGGGKQPRSSGRIYRESGARTRLDIPGHGPSLDRPRQRAVWCAARDRHTRRRAEPQRGEDDEQQQRG
jgi:endonuclease III